MGGNGSLNIYKYNNSDYNFPKNNGENGQLRALNRFLICSQPIIGYDWHNTKLGLSCLVAFDRTVKICNFSQLNMI